MGTFADDSDDYDIRFELRPDYLYVTVTSEKNSYDISKQYWSEIMNMLRRRRYGRVLIDKDIAEQLQSADAYTLVSELAFTQPSGVKIAILDRHYDAETNEFEQLVGRNRGLSLAITPDLEQAESYLGVPGN